MKFWFVPISVRASNISKLLQKDLFSLLLVSAILFTFCVRVVILVASVTLLFWVNEQLACFLSLQPFVLV